MRGRRRGALDFEEEVIGVAPPPVLSWLVRADDGVIGILVPMRCGVPVRGLVAAADVTAVHAKAKVQPSSPHPQAILTTGARGDHGLNGVEVSTCGRHLSPFLSKPRRARKAHDYGVGRSSARRSQEAHLAAAS